MSQRCPPRQTAPRLASTVSDGAALAHLHSSRSCSRAFRSVPSKFRALPLVLVMATGSTSAFAAAVDVLHGPARGYGRAPRSALHRQRGQPVSDVVSDRETEQPRPSSRSRSYDDIQSGWYACVATARLSRASAQPRSPLRLFRSTSRASNERRRSQHPVGRIALRHRFRAAGGVDRGPKVHRPETGHARHHEGIRRPVHFRVRTAAVSQARCRVPDQVAAAMRAGAPQVRGLVAPADGRTYPNLVDHRRNVEYDVERVLRLLKHEPVSRDRPFVNGPLSLGGTVGGHTLFASKPYRQQEGVS